ncbi:hypothetical protein GOBAR_DD03013 [Gossypium barbadense]|nr:hypothetical protein GOBAR_DD03013 [Gossypium barbadense]
MTPEFIGPPHGWIGLIHKIISSSTCRVLWGNQATPNEVYKQLPALATHGCCKPPTICGYIFVNPTLWTNPVNPAGDPDCNLWSNDQTQLCYNCNSCKAGLLGNLRREWRKANIILIVAVVVLIWVYIIACSAFKNAQTEDLFNRYKQGWT